MSVSKRADTNRWRGRYYDPSGRQRSKDFDTKSAATQWVAEQERRVRRGEWLDPESGKATVADLYPVWLDSLDLKPSTRTSYVSLWTTQVEPRWGRVRLDRVTPLDVRAWLSQMQGVGGRPLSASRRRQAFHVLASILDAAVADRRLLTNPAREGAGARSGFLPRLPKHGAHHYLTAEQLTRLADKAGDYRTLVLTLGFTGLRWGEVAALRVCDADLLRRRLRVTRAAVEINGTVTYGTPKTHASREVPIPAFLADLLAEQAAGRSRDDLLFTAPEGGPLSVSNFRARTWTPALKRAGIGHLRVHDLRHTAASLAVASGADVLGVQRMLGHASAAMTLDRYSGLFDTQLDDVAARLDATFSASLEASVRPEGRTVIPLKASK